MKACEHCDTEFTPRHGGSPQRFCSPPCRQIAKMATFRAANPTYYSDYAKTPERKAQAARWYVQNKEQLKPKHRATSAAWRVAGKQIETYVVYAGPEIIYVGRTDHWRSRLNQHKRDDYSGRSLWLDEMTDVQHRYHATYGDSMVDEALLVRLYQPKYNTIGVTK